MTDDGDSLRARVLGDAFADMFTLRARSRNTQRLVAAGQLGGSESSIDKVLIAAADQAVFGAARELMKGRLDLDDGPVVDRFRKEWLYSRAATIYGGTAEIQRDIIGHRLLSLPRDH